MWHSIGAFQQKRKGGTTVAWQSPRTLITSTGCFPARLNRIESGRRKKVAQLRGWGYGRRAVRVSGRAILRWSFALDENGQGLSRSAELTSLTAMMRRSGDGGDVKVESCSGSGQCGEARAGGSLREEDGGLTPRPFDLCGPDCGSGDGFEGYVEHNRVVSAFPPSLLENIQGFRTDAPLGCSNPNLGTKLRFFFLDDGAIARACIAARVRRNSSGGTVVYLVFAETILLGR
jgi:hypothetical protein